MQSDLKRWTEQMRTFERSHDGHVACYLVRHEYSLGMLIKAMSTNDPATILVLRAIGGWLKDAFDGKPPMCLMCEYEFQVRYEPTVFAVITPYPLDPEREGHHTIVAAICEQCAERYPTNDQLHPAVLNTWKRIYPGAHIVVPS